MNTNWRRFLAGFLSILWLTGVISAYYLYHKPFSGGLALHFARALGQGLVAVGIITAGGAVGTLALPRLALRPIECTALRAAVGLGLLSLVVLVCGITFGYSPLILALLLAIIYIGFRNQVLSWLGAWRGLWHYAADNDRFSWLVMASSAALLLLALIRALAPPLKFDALVYHLALPKTYLELGRFVYVERLMYWGMPQVGEMLYTWAMALGGVEAATFLGWCFGVLTLAGVLATADRILGRRAAWVAIASLLAGSTVASSLAWGYVGWQTQLFGWGMLVALAGWKQGRATRYLVLAGVCAGFAVGVKYTAGILFLTGLVYVLTQKPLPGGAGRLRAALLFSGAGFLVFSPWLLKNVFATGNPVYPLLIPAGAMDSLRLSLFQSQGAWGDLRDGFLLPWRATTLGLEGAPGYSASIGPLLLGFGGLAWLKWGDREQPSKNVLEAALTVAGLGIVVWAVAGRISGLLIQTRLYLALFPAISLLAGAGFEGLSRIRISKIRFGRLSGVLVLLVTWFGVIQAASASLSSGVAMTVFGVKEKDAYLAENLGWYAFAIHDLQTRSLQGPILMLWEPRSLYCSPHCIPDEVLDRWFHDLTTYGSPDEVLNTWRDMGITQLLVNHQGAALVASEAGRYPPETWQALETLLARLPVLMDYGGIYVLYQVAP